MYNKSNLEFICGVLHIRNLMNLPICVRPVGPGSALICTYLYVFLYVLICRKCKEKLNFSMRLTGMHSVEHLTFIICGMNEKGMQ